MSEQIVNQPFIYISGCQISSTSGTAFNVLSGKCRDSTDTFDLDIESSIVVSTAVRGAGGLDKGTIANNIWYYVHIIGDSRGFNAPSALISALATVPTLPSGYDLFRRIGTARTNGSAQILSTSHQGNGNLREYFYQTEKSVLNVLLDGADTTYTAVSCAALVPPTAQIASLLYDYSPHVANDKFFVRTTGTTLTESMSFPGPVVDKFVSGQFQPYLSSSQSIDYHVTTGTATLSLWVFSYKEYI